MWSTATGACLSERKDVWWVKVGAYIQQDVVREVEQHGIDKPVRIT